jgi:DNA-binding HxlR family transcriptional regulator
VEKDIDLFGKCPYVTAQKVFSGKWALLIINNLCGKTLRFGELQRKIPGITQATLTKQLRILEEYGMIKRHVYPEVPPKVEYSLSKIGGEFIPVLQQFEIFGTKYIDYLNTKK